MKHFYVMQEKNGMMTFFVLWAGTFVLLLALLAATCSQLYLQQAVRYRDGISATYAAESAVSLYWQELVKTAWSDVPKWKEWELDDPYGITRPEEQMMVQVTVEKKVKPYHGVVIAAGKNQRSGIRKTMTVLFDISEPHGNECPLLHIRQFSY